MSEQNEEELGEMTESLSQTIRADAFRGIAVLPAGVAALIGTLSRTMRNQRAPVRDVALMQKAVCEQFGILLPDFFAKDGEAGLVKKERDIIEEIIRRILIDGCNLEWMRVSEIKSTYCQLSKYSDNEIGRVCKGMQLQNKKPGNVSMYLFPSRESEGEA